MADNDDLMIEVTGSSDKAANAIDRVINKVTKMQDAVEKMVPSLTKFTERMDSLASSSKAFATLDRLTKSTGNVAAASKKAEANEAMYQARLDRANVSMDKSRLQAEKLSNAFKKVSEAEAIAAHNNAAFSMPTKEFAQKYNTSTGNEGINLTPEVPTDTYEPTPAPGYTKLASEMGTPHKVSFNFSTGNVQSEIGRIQNFIDGLIPHVSHMSSSAQAQFNELAEKIKLVSQQIDNQRGLYHNLASAASQAAKESGEGSNSYLRIEKRMLSADSAMDRLLNKQEKLKAEMSSVASSTEKAGWGFSRLGSKGEKSASKTKSAWSSTMRMMEKMLVRIAAFRIFSALSQGIVTGIQDMALASNRANSAMSALATNSLYLKNSVGAALMPVLQSLVPVLNQITDALTNVFNTIAALNARIFNHSSTVTIAKRANVDYAATLNKSGSGASNANKKIKELQRTVMGFDELNKLSKETESSTPKSKSGSGSAGMPSYGNMFKTVKVPGWVNKIGQVTDKIANFVKDNVNTLNRLLKASPLVIGAILVFSGANVRLGLGLMAVGAVLMAKQAKEDWDYLHDKTKTSLDKVKRLLAITGAVELALGAVLAFSGANVPLGIALMIGGITTTAATLNWDSLSPNIKKAMGAITFTSAVAMLALGAIFAFSGANIPLGVGLLIAGATTMWASKTLNWNSMDAQLKTKVATWTSIASGALLALGILLVCTGAAIPLGIGMIIAGGTGLASAVALNWDAITNKVKSVLDAIVGFFNSMWNNVVKTFEGFPGWWNGIWSKVGQILSDCWNNISAWFNKLPYNIGYALGAALAKIVNFGVDAWNWVTTDLPKIINGIVDWFKQLPGKIWTFLVDVVNKVIQWSKNLVTTAQAEIPKFVQKVVDFIGELPGKMLDIGKNIVQGIWNGITGAVDWLHTKIKGFCDGLLAGFKDNLKIHSPSAVFADVIGKNLALGLGYGFVNYMKPMAALMQDAVPTHFDLATAFSVPDLSSPSISVAAPLAAISNPQDSGILGYNSNAQSESGYAAILESLNKSREEMKDALLNHPTYLVTDNVKLAQAVNRGQRQITRTSPTNA